MPHEGCYQACSRSLSALGFRTKTERSLPPLAGNEVAYSVFWAKQETRLVAKMLRVISRANYQRNSTSQLFFSFPQSQQPKASVLVKRDPLQVLMAERVPELVQLASFH